ncbi:hypothetical protein D9611_006962 [Ephemerocybe angulata]|uniref:DNA mismatch repair protein MSH3 n=1 Tax=Ephemerocybe angulata TaxID=980116 RepID=A0A8H5EW49_9AGAR|nr:hypothetical protein D9611_006962 [Tulosesus angulatus]
MLNLRNVVTQLPEVRKALEGSRSQLLNILCDMVSDERLDTIERLISAHLNEEISAPKGGIGAVNAKVYAIKSQRNRLLDVARETYKENVGDIYQLNRDLSGRHDLPLTLVYREGSGFVFSLKASELEGAELPPGFVDVVKQKGRWVFSSMDLKKMNARMKDALDETLLFSDKIIQDLVAEILVNIGALYKASEAVALVDMLLSFAHVSIIRSYIRPEYTDTLAIKGGRHPVLEIVQPAGSLVANDVYSDSSSSFQIIQGPNMSGKSTYLRQLALLTIMSMVGCFVPAQYASIPLFDALLTRLSNDDDLERSLSTFASEMAGTAMILGQATARSLVLVDELGRGTSPREGVGISCAIAEALVKAKPRVFFATHYTELSTLLAKHPTVVNLHLSVQRTPQSSSNFGMIFRYKIVDGLSEQHTHYGLELARLADIPPEILQEGARVAARLDELQKRQEEESEGSRIALRRKVLLRLRTQLKQALDHSTLADDDLIDYLKRFHGDIARAFVHV